MKMSRWCIALVFIMEFSVADQEPIRLVNGPSRCAGRVEILYQNRWGPVCDDNWDTLRGGVVCRQLDCGVVLSAPGNAAFGFETDHFWLDDVDCNGSESKLSDCKAKPWGKHNCQIREAASAVCSGDLAKPNISLSGLRSGDLRLTCTVPPLHQSVIVHFYQADDPNPIKTISLSSGNRVKVHDIGAETAIQGAYQCQYEVKANRTSQVFLSPMSDVGTVKQMNSSSPGLEFTVTGRNLVENGSSLGPEFTATSRSPKETGPGPDVTVLATSIVVAFVVLAAVVAGLAFVYNKKWRSGNAAKTAGSPTENINDGRIMGSDQAKLRVSISSIKSPFPIHHYENRYVIQTDGTPGTPHIYEKVTPACRSSGPLNDANGQMQEKSGLYETMIQNNHLSKPSSDSNEGSTYQALTLETLGENVYDTLSTNQLKDTARECISTLS
ncbi:uncharacterized protein LOC144770383 isoform X2 [Lissotriton helveticus]